MREPNINELIESLASENFMEDIFRNGRNAEEEVSQLLYFMRYEQRETLYKEILELSPEKKNRVSKSLIVLFPLSKNIVDHLILKREVEPHNFLEIYDMNENLLSSVQMTLQEIQEKSSVSSAWYKCYLEKLHDEEIMIQRLKTDIERMNSVSGQVKEKWKIRQELQTQLDELRRDYESGSLDADIEELKKTIQELKIKKDKKDKEKQRLKKEFQEIYDSMKYGEEQGTRKFRKAYAALKDCIKSTAEGE